MASGTCTRRDTHDVSKKHAARPLLAPAHCFVVLAVAAWRRRAECRCRRPILEKLNFIFSKHGLGHVHTARYSQKACTARRRGSVSSHALWCVPQFGCMATLRRVQTNMTNFGENQVQFYFRKLNFEICKAGLSHLHMACHS